MRSGGGSHGVLSITWEVVPPQGGSCLLIYKQITPTSRKIGLMPGVLSKSRNPSTQETKAGGL